MGNEVAGPAGLPVPQIELLACAQELEGVLGELISVTEAGNAWGVRTLRRNVGLALERPETLADVENQLDFIEELAAAAWDGGDCGVHHPVSRGRWPAETAVREDLRRSAVTRLDETAELLCHRVEAWRRRTATPRGPRSRASAAHRF